jgi:hypothetical protein
MQFGFMLAFCFLCEWGSCANDHHYSAKEWPKHEQFLTGQKNI